ncbi:MAG: GNAT family N-acetyltransferase, partial [Deltaproteobacteria bacterium]|nr:GNAT family N-acetyltransferase [Deltaproteobacteria bacterium]
MSLENDDTKTFNAGGIVEVRRLRRTDFTAVMRLLADAGSQVPSPDRRTLRRFRHIAADLGSDVYICLVDGTLAGLLHLTYARQLTTGPRGRIEALLVGTTFRRRGIGRALLDLALRRAAKRSCRCIDCATPPDGAGAIRLLARAGFACAGATYRCPLDVDDTSPED